VAPFLFVDSVALFDENHVKINSLMVFEMMVYGEGVSSMYSVIVEGRKRELIAAGKSREAIIEEIGNFTLEVKQLKRNDFNEMYELYKVNVHGKTGTVRILKPKKK